MSHAFAARGARQTAVLAAMLGLHFAVFIVVATGFGPRDIASSDDWGQVTVVPKPDKPEQPIVPPSQGPTEDYHVGVVDEPIIPIPDFPRDDGVTVTDPDGTAGESVTISPPVELVRPTIRSRAASIAAAINACYPSGSRRLNEEGTVVALVTIGADGSAVNWSVAQSSGFARLDAAIGCVLSKLQFTAGRRDGQAVSMEARLPIVFRLD